MKKFYLFIYLFSFSAFIYCQEGKEDKFNTAENLFLKGQKEGDFVSLSKADSIFKFLKKDKRLNVKQRLSAEVYSLLINDKESIDKNQIDNLLAIYYNEKLTDKTLYNRILFFKEISDFESSIQKDVQKPKTFLQKINIEKEADYYLIARTNRFLALYFYDVGDYENSVLYSKEAAINFNRISYDYWYALSLQVVGGAFYNLQKIDSALYYIKKSYTETKKQINPNAESISKNAFNIGMMLQGKKLQTEEAQEYYKEAIAFAIKDKGEENPALITYYSVLADTYYFLKDITQAEFYANKAYVLANDIVKTENVYLKSLPSLSLAQIFEVKKDYTKARNYIDNVIEDCLTFYGENNTLTIQAFRIKAVIEDSASNTKEAEAYYTRALNASVALNRLYSILGVNSDRFHFYEKTKNYEMQLQTAKSLVDNVKSFPDEDYKTKAEKYYFLGKSYSNLKEIDSAYISLKTMETLLDKKVDLGSLKIQLISLQNDILYADFLKNNSLIALEESFNNIEPLLREIISGKALQSFQDSKIYYSKSITPHLNKSMEIVLAKQKNKETPETLNLAFKLMELNKSSVLLDGIIDHKLKIEKGVPLQTITFENETKNILLNLNNELYAIQDTTATGSALKKNLVNKQMQLNLQLDSIHAHLKKNFPQYYQAKNLTEAQSLEFYQKQVLKNGQCVVEYYMNDERLYRMIISKREIHLEELSKSAHIKRDVENFLAAIQEKGDLSVLSKNLGDAILPSFSSDIKEIIFITDGALSRIPFEILDYKNAYLLQNFAVSYAGSLQLYHEQVALHKKKNNSLKWLGFAPDYKDKSLAAHKNEVSSIAKLTKGDYRIGKDATKQNFINTSNNASILHLATHAELDNLNPMLNKMLFYDSGEGAYELTAAEIYGLDLQANLAVLSACETGSGIYETDGVMSMSRAFTYAGVPSTVMSLWKVPDAQTSMIMVSFYENLDKGQQKNEALKNAKMSYLDNVKQPELKHPYYWAGFVVSGDISPLQNQTSFWWYIFAVLIVLVFLFILFRRKKKSV